MSGEEGKVEHLQMIQGVIDRMAGNSFLIKGWSVTLAVALMALSSKEAEPVFVFLVYIPVAVFWLLDGYYLWKEKLFRDLYDVVRQKPVAADFNMKVTGGLAGLAKACWRPTVIAVHGVLAAAIVLVFYLR